MRYLGGKSRIAKEIGGVIDDAVSGRQVKNSLTISTNVRGGVKP